MKLEESEEAWRRSILTWRTFSLECTEIQPSYGEDKAKQLTLYWRITFVSILSDIWKETK
jgi:hypothetical protein